MNQFDVIILGAGAAGLAAGLYATRRQLSTLILTGDIGGQTATTMDIENYPGVEFSTGPDLMAKFADQAKGFGAQITFDPAIKISPQDGDFAVETMAGQTYLGRSVIIATGKHHRHLDVPGEAEFSNKGVVYCATCDAPLFAGKSVVVIGGGSAAFDAALLLAKICPEVTLVHRRTEFRAEPILVERAQAEPKIKFLLDSQVVSIQGDNFVRSITVATPEGNKELPTEGVFVEIGQIVDTRFVAGLVEITSDGEIVIDANNQTTHPGIFAAGDVTTVPFKQTVISAGEGAKAALAAYNYLMGRDPGAKFADQGYIK